jgi:hypothetical protein
MVVVTAALRAEHVGVAARSSVGQPLCPEARWPRNDGVARESAKHDRRSRRVAPRVTSILRGWKAKPFATTAFHPSKSKFRSLPFRCKRLTNGASRKQLQHCPDPGLVGALAPHLVLEPYVMGLPPQQPFLQCLARALVKKVAVVVLVEVSMVAFVFGSEPVSCCNQRRSMDPLERLRAKLRGLRIPPSLTVNGDEGGNGDFRSAR